MHKSYDAGRGFAVVTTGCRGFADYVVRDLTLRSVSLSVVLSIFIINKVVTWEAHVLYTFT